MDLVVGWDIWWEFSGGEVGVVCLVRFCIGDTVRVLKECLKDCGPCCEVPNGRTESGLVCAAMIGSSLEIVRLCFSYCNKGLKDSIV